VNVIFIKFDAFCVNHIDYFYKIRFLIVGNIVGRERGREKKRRKERRERERENERERGNEV